MFSASAISSIQSDAFARYCQSLSAAPATTRAASAAPAPREISLVRGESLLLDDLLVLHDRLDDLLCELVEVRRRLDRVDDELGGDDVRVPADRRALALQRLRLAEDDERRVGVLRKVRDAHR